jgi:parvulin-like peptidyl-prolyl isomerase
MRARWELGRGVAAAVVLAALAGTSLGQAAKPLALVNGQPIYRAEVDAILKRQPPSATPLTEAQQKQMQGVALDFLINDMLMKQFLERQRVGKPPLSPHGPEVNKQLAEFDAALKKKNNSLAQFLKETGQTEEDVRASIVKELQWEAYVSEHLKDEDVKRYYDENKVFFDKVMVRASHILIRVPAAAKPAEREAARAKLLALRKEIVAGKIDFAEAAKKYSGCPTAPNGGDLSFFPRKGAVQEPFAKAAYALNKGEVSDVVETDYGLHLIKVTDRMPGEPSTFDKVKDDVRRMCVEEMGQDILVREHKAAKIQINWP